MTSRYAAPLDWGNMSDQPNFSQQPHDSKLDSMSPVDDSGNAAHKRKRDPSDHDGSMGGAGDNGRRSSFKRVSPSGLGAMSSTNASGGTEATDSFLSNQQQSGPTG